MTCSLNFDGVLTEERGFGAKVSAYFEGETVLFPYPCSL